MIRFGWGPEVGWGSSPRCLPCRNPLDLVQLFLAAVAGEHMRGEGAVYLKGEHVRVESPTPVPVQLDGDSAGHTPVDIDLLPTRLPFIVP